MPNAPPTHGGACGPALTCHVSIDASFIADYFSRINRIREHPIEYRVPEIKGKIETVTILDLSLNL